MARDYRWMSNGDILVDGTGDIALSSADGIESLQDMARTRMKAALNGWQMYPIGADLKALIGRCNDAELEDRCRQQINQALTNQFLPRGSVQIETLVDGPNMSVFVYISAHLLATAVLNTADNTLRVQ